MNKITITCYGGCGRTVTLRENKVNQADYYLCASKACGDECKSKLPPLLPGKVRCITMNAAAHFWGYTDIWDAEASASVIKAREILSSL